MFQNKTRRNSKKSKKVNKIRKKKQSYNPGHKCKQWKREMDDDYERAHYDQLGCWRIEKRRKEWRRGQEGKRWDRRFVPGEEEEENDTYKAVEE